MMDFLQLNAFRQYLAKLEQGYIPQSLSLHDVRELQNLNQAMEEGTAIVTIGEKPSDVLIGYGFNMVYDGIKWEYEGDYFKKIYTSDQGNSYSVADFERLAYEALIDFARNDKKKYDIVLRTSGGSDVRTLVCLFSEQLQQLAEWENVETLIDQFMREPEVHFPELENQD